MIDLKLSKEEYKKLKEKPRDRLEAWINLHNHKLELIRTIGNVISGIGGALAILRIFGII